MAINRAGFEILNNGLQISKDPAAQLTYTLDWSEWLDQGDVISSVDWSVAARRNDPTPVTIVTSGKDGSNIKTYVELAGGQADKTYIVTAQITTDNGLVDARSFRVLVESRQA
jgi:hypothetical protein